MNFGLRRAKMLRLIVAQLVSKIFNLCGHDPPTPQTDRQTTCDHKTAICTIVRRAVEIIGLPLSAVEERVHMAGAGLICGRGGQDHITASLQTIHRSV